MPIDDAYKDIQMSTLNMLSNAKMSNYPDKLSCYMTFSLDVKVFQIK